MNTNLFFFNGSFRQSPGITINDFECAIERLLEACELARTNSDNIYRDDSIYTEVICSDSQVYQVLFESHLSLSRDHRQALMKMFDRSISVTRSEQEQIDSLETHSETDVFGLLCLYNITDVGIDGIFMINSGVDWYSFHRNFLGIYPVSEPHYFSECKRYFPALFFHDMVETSLTTLEGGLPSFSKNIVNHLIQLNDHYSSYHIPDNRGESLRQFSIACGIEVTPEGIPTRKRYFTFQFIDDNNTINDVCCEPHTKLFRSDNSRDTTRYGNRIYFNEGRDHIQSGKILVGHIGRHL